MIQNIKKIIKNIFSPVFERAFYAVVKCSDCGEEVSVRIDRSADFQMEYSTHNPEHCYTVTKEIIGKTCFNLMRLTIALTKDAKVLFADAKACDFLKFYRE